MFSENISSVMVSIFPQDVDLVAAATTITAERATVVDFSYLYWEEKLGMLTGTVSGEPFYMFKPLHVYVWICFPAAGLVAAICAACHEVSNEKIVMTSEKGFMLPLELMGYILKAMWVQGKFWFPYFLEKIKPNMKCARWQFFVKWQSIFSMKKRKISLINV